MLGGRNRRNNADEHTGIRHDCYVPKNYPDNSKKYATKMKKKYKKKCKVVKQFTKPFDSLKKPKKGLKKSPQKTQIYERNLSN